MDIKRLEIFGVAAHEESFTKAAEKLFTSQPAVSMQIKLLEQETGLKLFKREGRSVKLTREGRMLYERAQKILQDIREAEELVNDIKGLKKGGVSIGASSTPGVYILPELIGTFRKKHGSIQVHLSINNTESIAEKVLRGDVQVGFVGGEIASKQLAAFPFARDLIIPVFPGNHALRNKKNISLKELASEPFILREKGSATRSLLEERLRKKNLHLENVVMEVGNSEGIKRAVTAGLGISFLSQFTVKEELKSRALSTTKHVPLKLQRMLRIIMRKNVWISPSLRLFLSFCEKVFCIPLFSLSQRAGAAD